MSNIDENLDVLLTTHQGNIYLFQPDKSEIYCLKNDLNLIADHADIIDKFIKDESDYSHKSACIKSSKSLLVRQKIICINDENLIRTSIPLKSQNPSDRSPWLILLSAFKISDKNKNLERIISYQKKIEYADLFNILSEKEKVILKGIGEGLDIKEIAENLNVAYSTVVTHRKRLFNKLKTRKSAQLAVWADNFGLLESV
jgi:DNA-binding CsgD family transcriptional regulator